MKWFKFLPIFFIFFLVFKSSSAPLPGLLEKHSLSGKVETTLRGDTRIAISDLIITEGDSTILIAGAVNSVTERIYAELAAQKIRGVKNVVNNLLVKPESRSDSSISKDVRNRLFHNTLIDSAEIAVLVSHGEVTLLGKVFRTAQSREAARLVKRVRGVRTVRNNLEIFHSPPRFDEDIRQDVISKISRDIYLAGLPINVQVTNRSVLLSGTVSSAYQKARAVRTARQISDVEDVDCLLQIDWQSTPDILNKSSHMTNQQLSSTVLDELYQDLAITDPFVITTESSLGHLTIRGTVPSSYHKQAAEENAREIPGVIWISNLLHINPARREDKNIQNDIQFDLDSDYLFVNKEIAIQVEAGIVTLSGDVNTLYEKVCAADIASRVRGVLTVINHISNGTSSNQNDGMIWKTLKTRLISNWLTYLVSGRIDIAVKDGIVTLTGDVDTWLERHEAIRIAYLTKGVREVENEITIDGKSIPGDKLYNEEFGIFSFKYSHPLSSFFFEYPF